MYYIVAGDECYAIAHECTKLMRAVYAMLASEYGEQAVFFHDGACHVL